MFYNGNACNVANVLQLYGHRRSRNVLGACFRMYMHAMLLSSMNKGRDVVYTIS